MPCQFYGCHSDTQSLGFIIHLEKSVIIPEQTIICLEFVISSTNMTLSLTGKKKTKIKNCSKDIFFCKIETIELIGNLVVSLLNKLPQTPKCPSTLSGQVPKCPKCLSAQVLNYFKSPSALRVPPSFCNVF